MNMGFDELYERLMEQYNRYASDHPYNAQNNPEGFLGGISAGEYKEVNPQNFPTEEDFEKLKRLRKRLTNRRKKPKH